MDEEVQFLLDVAKEKMTQAISHLEKALLKIRAGKASPTMLNGVFVDYYGTSTPLNQVANIGTTDARTIVIQPWEKNMINPIEKAILAANLGFNPDNNGEIIRINVPMLTEERRASLVKQVKHEGEESRISIRNTRRETIEELKKMKKDGLSEDMEKTAEEKVQKMTDKYYAKIDEVLAAKEKDIMTI
ncbi:MAG: ribosome recycling factor [Bacteroidales bacterium]